MSSARKYVEDINSLIQNQLFSEEDNFEFTNAILTLNDIKQIEAVLKKSHTLHMITLSNTDIEGDEAQSLINTLKDKYGVEVIYKNKTNTQKWNGAKEDLLDIYKTATSAFALFQSGNFFSHFLQGNGTDDLAVTKNTTQTKLKQT